MRAEARATGLTVTRRTFLGSAAASVLHAQQRRMNIVLILADDLGWADTAVYGADLHETPHIDRLAAEGMRFTNACAAAPICSPTRASIMAGKHPARLHMTIWYEGSKRVERGRKLIPPATVSDLPHAEVTLAELLQPAGYLSASVGKWHLGDAAHYPETQGFDVNIGGTFWGAPQTFFSPYRGDRLFGGEKRYVPGLPFGKPGEYLTDRLTEEALGVMHKAGDEPFFLYLAHHAPHTPLEAKAELGDHYRRKLKPGMRHQNPTYAAMVHSLDESVGRVMAELRARRIEDRTVVIFTSDNGGYLQGSDGTRVTTNHPLRSGKGSLYEGGVRVPLIVKWPGVTRAGTVSAEPVVSTDLYRTIADVAGVPAGGDGVSLHPVLRDPSARLDRDALYFHYPHYYATTSPVSAIRARDWKLLHYYEDSRVELFNLANDPGEEHDLAAQLPGRADELKAKLDLWLRDVNALRPEPNPSYSKP